jgi:hypothetical protein
MRDKSHEAGVEAIKEGHITSRQRDRQFNRAKKALDDLEFALMAFDTAILRLQKDVQKVQLEIYQSEN